MKTALKAFEAELQAIREAGTVLRRVVLSWTNV